MIRPENHQKKASLSNISFLASIVAKSLGEKALRKTFNLGPEKTKHDFIEIIRVEFMEYQTQNISSTRRRIYLRVFMLMNLMRNQSLRRNSYWREAYGIAGIEDDRNSNASQFK